jgi:ABC-type phosphate/phosphonate transport system substrate-binding protein
MIKKALSCLACIAFSTIAIAQQTYVFAINEGVTYRTGSDVTRQNYKPIADDLSRLLKAKVRIEVIGDYATLEKDLAAKTYDIAFIHPTHIALTPVKKGTYSLVAVSKAHANYKASFLSKMNAQPKSAEELGKLLATVSKPVGSPDSNSITAWLIRATLRDAAAAAKSSSPQLKFTRYQDSIPFMVDNGFVEVAATASEAIVKEWTAAGGRVIATSKPVPVKNVIVSEAMGNEAAEAIKAYFIELVTTADGQAKLERIGLKQGFIAYDQAAYVALGTWLGL